MKRLFTCLLFALLLLSACATPSGGGSGTVNQKAVVYGIGENGIAFVIYTDIPVEGTLMRVGGESGFFSSEQSGLVKPQSGLALSYASDEVRLEINEQEFKLAEGRVFLATTENDNLSIDQLNVPVESVDFSTDNFEAVVHRLAEENNEISEFVFEADQ